LSLDAARLFADSREAEGQDPVRKMDNGSPEVLKLILEGLPDQREALSKPHRREVQKASSDSVWFDGRQPVLPACSV
jgi:hypothetical protein